MEATEWRHGDYTISTDPERFDIEIFHRYLSEESYWARGRAHATTEATVANSIVFGVYASGGDMVGAARVVTDRATFGWLCDVFVLDAHRGRGLGKALIEAVTAHPELVGLRRLLLSTGDAHGLYEQYGFQSIATPERWMERARD